MYKAEKCRICCGALDGAAIEWYIDSLCWDCQEKEDEQKEMAKIEASTDFRQLTSE